MWYGDIFKTKTCRAFDRTKYCEFGSACLYRHDFKRWFQIHRHYHMPHFYLFESMANYGDEAVFGHVPVTKTLGVFQAIHNNFDF